MNRLYLVRWEYGAHRRGGLVCVWAGDAEGAESAARQQLGANPCYRFDPARLRVVQVTGTRLEELPIPRQARDAAQPPGPSTAKDAALRPLRKEGKEA